MFNLIVETSSVDLTVYYRSFTYSSSTFVFVMSKGVDKFAQQRDITLVLVRVEISVSGGCLSSCGRRARERESATGSSVRDGVPVETKAEASWWTGPVALLAAH